MSENRQRGLFEALFLRVMIVITVALALMIMLSHLYQRYYLNRAWRSDLQQEAIWTARHFVRAPPSTEDAPATAAAGDLGEAWRQMHEHVRLVVRNAAGEVVVDSHPRTPPPEVSGIGYLRGRASIERGDGDWELMLSRPVPSPFPADASLAMVLVAIAIILFAAALLYPLTRRLTRAFEAIGAEAGRVATGEFGAPLAARGVRELDQLVTAFNTMSRRLAGEQARRQRLIGDVSHELRSPLGRMRAIGETIVRHPEEASALIAQNEAELALLERVIADLLDTARLEEGDDGLARENVELAEWWRTSMDRLRLGAAREGVVLEVAAPATDAVECVDARRLLQALANVIDNAVNACAGRAGATVVAALNVDAESWSVVVTDNGRGIPAGSLPYVFDRFYRVEKDRGRRTGGAGLGLCIAKAITEAHGGSITIESNEGQGTIVRMRFPRR